jgi:16S rRNA (guanine(966)-N(2))-methyltransferase RsmD
MSIRVIAGSAKGRKLKPVPGKGTRPVMDRVKEALFNILGDRIEEASFLDLYAGTGSVGIEALSRGAERAVFVENGRLAVKTIQENLALTDLAEFGEVRRQDVLEYLQQEAPEAFEFVYIAPPQYKNLWYETLIRLDQNPGHLCPDGITVVQIDPQEKREVLLEVLVPFDERRYGNTLLWFFERPGE